MKMIVSDMEVSKKYTNLYQSAQKRNIEFGLTLNKVRELLETDVCHYTKAPYTAENPKTIDRIDSSKGYYDDNVVACTVTANQAKANLDLESLKRITKTMEETLNLSRTNLDNSNKTEEILQIESILALNKAIESNLYTILHQLNPKNIDKEKIMFDNVVQGIINLCEKHKYISTLMIKNHWAFNNMTEQTTKIINGALGYLLDNDIIKKEKLDLTKAYSITCEGKDCKDLLNPDKFFLMYSLKNESFENIENIILSYYIGNIGTVKVCYINSKIPQLTVTYLKDIIADLLTKKSYFYLTDVINAIDPQKWNYTENYIKTILQLKELNLVSEVLENNTIYGNTSKAFPKKVTALPPIYAPSYKRPPISVNEVIVDFVPPTPADNKVKPKKDILSSVTSLQTPHKGCWRVYDKVESKELFYDEKYSRDNVRYHFSRIHSVPFTDTRSKKVK